MSSSANITTDKIWMIKHTRTLTRVLGTLGIKSLTRDNQSWVDYFDAVRRGQLDHIPKPHANVPSRFQYGWGLKESKDFVEQYLDRKARSAST